MFERQPHRETRILFNVLGLLPGAFAVQVLTGKAETLLQRWDLQENALQWAWTILGISVLFVIAGQVRLKKD